MSMPVGQVNAILDDALQMRVGIPHKGGKLAVHAFDQDWPAMVSANAFWNAEKGAFKFPEYTDLSELDFALDSAGFVAVSNFMKKGRQAGMAGIFPWTAAQYLEFANTTGCAWYTAPDLCCEPAVATSQAEIDYRIDATATLLEACLRILYDWQNELAKTCNSTTVANMLKPPVPAIQGWRTGDYQRSLELTMDVWQRWQPWLAAPALIGIGSVCKRHLTHPQHGLFSILGALEGYWPEASKAHLFGVKGSALTKLKTMSWIGSTDSMAWDSGARWSALKAGKSNTLGHRCEEMSAWMAAALNRVKPAAGDQLRLSFT